MGVSIRQAVAADVPALMVLGKAMHAESPRFSHLRFNAAKAEALLVRLLPGGGALVAERDGIIVGMMAGYTVPLWFSDDVIASDFVLYLIPEERRKGRAAFMLVRAFENWAIAQGAVDIAPSTTTGVDPEGTARFYEKLGYGRTGISLFKRVRNV
jgi:GNAT superfamily N-acetyltransferase